MLAKKVLKKYFIVVSIIITSLLLLEVSCFAQDSGNSGSFSQVSKFQDFYFLNIGGDIRSDTGRVDFEVSFGVDRRLDFLLYGIESLLEYAENGNLWSNKFVGELAPMVGINISSSHVYLQCKAGAGLMIFNQHGGKIDYSTAGALFSSAYAPYPASTSVGISLPLEICILFRPGINPAIGLTIFDAFNKFTPLGGIGLTFAFVN
jgi:hypothetical protein